MPNSFAPDDGLQLQAEGEGWTKNAASENACRRAMAQLLLTNPSEVVLRPIHWKVGVDELLAAMPGKPVDGNQKALPVHVSARKADAGVDAKALCPAVRDARVSDILRHVLQSHGGSFDPARISNKLFQSRHASSEAKAFEQLNRLLKPRELRAFIDRHPEFSWSTCSAPGTKGMLITWSRTYASGSGDLPPAATADFDSGVAPGTVAVGPPQTLTSLD